MAGVERVARMETLLEAELFAGTGGAGIVGLRDEGFAILYRPARDGLFPFNEETRSERDHGSEQWQDII